MNTTLVLPGHIADRVRDLACLEVETGGVLLASLVRTPAGDTRLLATELHEVPEDAYEKREAQQLLIRSHGYVPALARAEELHAVPIWFHTHPGDRLSPRTSKHDKIVDSQLTDLFRLRADSDFYGALIISVDGADLNFTGHLDDGETITTLDRLWVVGPRLALRSNYDAKRANLPGLFDRNIRAFGGDVQAVLGDLTVAVVGCGGTGSIVAEQLVRLGVRHLALIDSDTLSESNVTRVYGSTLADVGRNKVDVLADHLLRIAPDLEVRRVASMITVERTARELIGADVVFGCTDDNAGRLILSRLATFALIPIIDCGVLLSSDNNGRLVGVDGRVTVMYPGAACLVCRGRVDIARAASEMLTPEERVRRVEEGYAPALHGIEPAVVTFTTLVGGMAAAELIERLTHYGDEPVPSEVLLRLHDRELSTNSQLPRDRHYCDPAAGKLGLGDSTPFLGADMAGIGRPSWTRWLWLPWRRWSFVQAVEAADEIPDQIPRKGVVVVGSLTSPKWLAFDCPCSERHRVMLNADSRRRPFWKIRDNNRLTLSPSIDETRGSKRCHYLIQRGRIRWASS